MDNILELIKRFILIYFIYYVSFIFITTTVVYFTYRFWRFIFLKQESDVFITNASVIWVNQNNETVIKEKIQGMIVESIEDYMENYKRL